MDLPAILIDHAGRAVAEASDWPRRRRELISGFAEHVYGTTPTTMPALEILEDDQGVACEVDGVAVIRRQLRIGRHDCAHPGVRILLWQPAQGAAAVPAFVLLNFLGNHTTCHDPAVIPSEIPPYPEPVQQCRWTAPANQRGGMIRRFPIATICARGYAVGTACCHDIAPDHPLHFSRGLAGSLAHNRDSSWRTIGRWAWGLAALHGAVSTVPGIDSTRIIAAGHSRLGKAALWAGALDDDFAMICATGSGCCGASLAAHCTEKGETLAKTLRDFPHWYTPHFASHVHYHDSLPVDQHQLLACIAPRPVVLCEAEDDHHADPEGALAALRASAEAYDLLGVPSDAAGLPANCRFNLRKGGHELTAEDWAVMLDHADRQLGT